MNTTPEPLYKYRIVIRKDGTRAEIRTRIPDCHPDQPHRAHGLCSKCLEKKRNLLGRKARSKAEPVNWPKSTCTVCQRAYTPLVQGKEELDSQSRFCTPRCQYMYDALQPGDGWRSIFPGAAYQRMADAPSACPRCKGSVFETETGVTCLSCGRVFTIVERLVRAILLGYDDAYAALQYEHLLEAIESDS